VLNVFEPFSISGHGRVAPTSIDDLKVVLDYTKSDPLRVLAGSGINPSNVLAFMKVLLPRGLREIHLSGGEWVPSQADHYQRPSGMGMGIGDGEWAIWRTNEETIRQVRAIVDMVWDEFIAGRT
jgi:copper homeostasis protein